MPQDKHHHAITWLTLGGLLVLSVAVVIAGYRVASLDTSIEELIREIHHQPISAMQTLTEEVTTRSGRTITVTTTRREGESVDDFLARHNEAVDAAKAL